MANPRLDHLSLQDSRIESTYSIRPLGTRRCNGKLIDFSGIVDVGGKAAPGGIRRRFDAVARVGLVENTSYVVAHRVDADVQSIGNLPVGLACGHNVRHFDFTRRQTAWVRGSFASRHPVSLGVRPYGQPKASDGDNCTIKFLRP